MTKPAVRRVKRDEREIGNFGIANETLAMFEAAITLCISTTDNFDTVVINGREYAPRDLLSAKEDEA